MSASTRRTRSAYARRMRIHVAFVPALLREPAAHAVAVVDVLRASTSLATMFERGLSRAIVESNLRNARKRALEHYALLCGEVNALPAAGFDFGNSPTEFAGLSLEGKTAVLMTTNGTRAIAACAEAPIVCIAAFVNRRAAARFVVAEATRAQTDVAIACAGHERGKAFSLEDTTAAGALVEAAIEERPSLEMSDAAWAALHLWRWYTRDPMRAFREAAHARALLRLGFEEDLHFAAQLDVFGSVPVLYEDAGVRSLRLPADKGAAKTA